MTTIVNTGIHVDAEDQVKLSTATNGLRIGPDVTVFVPHNYHDAQVWLFGLIATTQELSARMAQERETHIRNRRI